MKNKISISSVVLAALGYLYMVIVTATGTGEGLSLTTFLLWSMLAWITTFTTWKTGGNPGVPAIYGIGASSTTVVLLLKGKYAWTTFDTVIAVLVAICIVLWHTKGAKKALVLSVAASATASLPFIVMTWQSPAGSPIVPNSAFLVANILSFVSAKGWTLQDRLYPGVNVIVCGLLVTPWLLK